VSPALGYLFLVVNRLAYVKQPSVVTCCLVLSAESSVDHSRAINPSVPPSGDSYAHQPQNAVRSYEMNIIPTLFVLQSTAACQWYYICMHVVLL